MRRYFSENLVLKIAAVLLSLVLWFYVTSRGQSEISLEVPVEFTNIPSGLEIINYDVRTVSVSIKGQERLIKDLRPSNIRVTVNLSRARKGESTYSLRKEDIIMPHSLAIRNIEPESIRVRMEETREKLVKVFPVIQGEPERGYFVKSLEVAPETVLIEGSRSEIAGVKSVRTEPLDITGLTETVVQDLRFDLRGRDIRVKKGEVSVRVVIEERKR